MSLSTRPERTNDTTARNDGCNNMVEWSIFCPVTGERHGEAWACGSCLAQNPRAGSSREPEVDSEQEIDPDDPVSIMDLTSEPDTIDLVSENESEPGLEVVDLVSESEAILELEVTWKLSIQTSHN
jgi:hypothetical protein